MTLGSKYHFIYFYHRCINFGTSASLRKLCGRKDYSCNFRRLASAPNLMHELIRLRFSNLKIKENLPDVIDKIIEKIRLIEGEAKKIFLFKLP